MIKLITTCAIEEELNWRSTRQLIQSAVSEKESAHSDLVSLRRVSIQSVGDLVLAPEGPGWQISHAVHLDFHGEERYGLAIRRVISEESLEGGLKDRKHLTGSSEFVLSGIG